jgi:tyrosinase
MAVLSSITRLIAGNVFPTWHRPYLVLYEQLLAANFGDIINQYKAQSPDLGAQFEAEAITWRLPYWDWAQNSDIPPDWTASKISIFGFDGKPDPFDNPFVAYRFQRLDGYGFQGSFTVYPTTMRCPSTADKDAQSQPEIANEWLAKADFKGKIMDLFPTPLFEPDPWGQFSNHTWDKIHSGTLTSLEGIHDTVHLDIGGIPSSGPNSFYGNMTDSDYSSFDPIFFLHHCNVDRLLTLWMAGHPTIFVSPGPNLDGRASMS